MSGLLHEWIVPVLEEKLGAAFEILKKNHWSQNDLDEAALAYRQRVLTIHCTKGKCAQVIDFKGQDVYPSSVTLSDGHCLIQATFNQSSVELFEKQSGRDLSSTRGGTINVREFCFVFDFAATPPRELTLQVSTFKFIGAEGSRTVGSPRDISNVRSVQQALIRIKQAMSNEQSIPPRRIPLPQIPQHESQSTARDYSLSFGIASQAGFATQAERPKFSERVVAPNVPAAAGPPAYASLLSLLKKKKNPKVNDLPGSSKGILEKEIQDPSMDDSPNSQRRMPLAQVSNDRMLEMTSRLEAMVNLPTSNTKKSSHSMSSSCPSSQSMANSQQSAKPAEDSLRLLDDRDSRHENQQSYDQASLGYPSNGVYKAHQVCEQQRQGRGMAFVDLFQKDDPFKGLKRIPRKYLQITEEQNAILEGASWFDQASNHSYASIPNATRDSIAALLKELNAEPNDSDSDAVSVISGHSGEDVRQSDINVINKIDPSFRTRNIGADDSKSEISNTNDKFVLDVSHFNNSIVTAGSVQQESQQPQSHQSRCSASLVSEEGSESLGLQFGADNLSLRPELRKSPSQEDIIPLNRSHVKPNYRKSRYPQSSIHFPSSCLSEEDEIELAVPHAIGDVVDESDGEEQSNDLVSPEWPSTAVQDIQVVQVNQTPMVNSRFLAANHLQHRDELDLGNPNTSRLDDVLSDSVIPATFHDVSPQYSKTFLDTATPNRSIVPLSTATPSNAHSTHTSIKSPQNDLLLATSKWMDAGESMEALQDVEQQDVERLSENAKTQHEFETPFISPKLHAMPPCSESVLDTPKRGQDLAHNKTPSPFRTFSSLSPEIIDLRREASSSPIPLSDSPNIDTPGPRAYSSRSQSRLPSRSSPHPTTLTTLKRNSESVAESPSTKLSKRQRHRSIAAAILDEDEYTPRDTKEMARASRHNFHELIPAATKPNISSPVPRDIHSVSSTSTHAQLRQSTLLDRPPGIYGSSVFNNLVDCSYPQDQICSTPSPDQMETVRPLEKTDLQHSSSDSSWRKFKIIYPDYEGSKSHFTKTLVYVEWLNKQNLLLQSCFCDDFVRVFASEYLDYIEQCKTLKTKPGMNGWQFYVKHIKTRLYQRDIISLDNLQEALASLDVERVDEYRQLFESSTNEPHSGQHKRAQNSVEDRQPTVQSTKGKFEYIRRNNDHGEHQGSRENSLETVSPRNAPMPREPFFETRSQLLVAGQQRQSSPPSGKARKTKAIRTLPWSGVELSPSPGEISLGSSSRSTSGNGTPTSSQRPGQHGRSKTSRMQPPGSPILGRQYEPTASIRDDAARRAITPTTAPRQAPGLLSSPKCEPRTAEKSPSENKAVQGWLEGVKEVDSRFKNDKFWKFAHKRLSSGNGFSSRASTPSSTPVKRFCTKSVEGATFGAKDIN